MATTTNYSWTTPDDTDLVKDGAAAIRTLGSSADTTVKNLNPGTTAGDVDYYTSGTAKARIGIGTAGQVLKVNSGATAPEWGADPVADVITTAGDLIYGTAADTVARLGIGTAGQVLKVNSGATAPEWGAAAAGALSLVNRTTFSNVASQTFDNVFSSTYKFYLVVIESIGAVAGADDLQLQLRSSGGTKTVGYYGVAMKFIQGGAVSQTDSTNVAQFTLSDRTAEPTLYSTYGNLWFGGVGTTGTRPSIYGQLNNTDVIFGNSVFGSNSDDATTFTGFLLKSSSSNITGTVATYGLATA